MDRQRGRFTTEQAKQELNRRGLWSYVEPVLTMGSAAFAEPVSGLMGLAALPYGSEASARAIANTQEAMTYQPRTEDGQQGLQDVGEFMQPVGDAFIGASEYLGDTAYSATGSPALATAAYSVPTMALEALGLKGARYASKGRAAYEMGDIGTQASKYGGKQRGAVGGITPQDALKELEARGIDMSTDARLQRAKEMGFDTDQVYYHGTDRDFSEFKSIGERDYGHYGQGYYFAPDPFTSNYYAESAAKVRGGAPTSYPVRLKYKKPYYLDEFTDEPQALQAGQDPKFTENLKKKGYDAVIRRSIDRDSSTGEILDEYLEEIVVFEPSQIRSINASFNPEHIDSGDLIK